MKVCAKCNIEKPKEKFTFRKNSKDGFFSSCKDCKRKYDQERCALQAHLKLHPLPEIKVKNGYKICSKCKIEKPFSEITKSINRKNGLGSSCKECAREYLKINNEEINKRRRGVSRREKEKINLRSKNYYEKNKENRLKVNQQYRNENIRKILDQRRKRSQSDDIYRFKNRIRALIRGSINRRGFSKKSKTFEILGCSYDEFIVHLENKFTEGMSWDNRNKWEIDHKIPIASAKNEEDVILLNHYSNLQPLWMIDNRRKWCKV